MTATNSPNEVFRDLTTAVLMFHITASDSSVSEKSTMTLLHDWTTEKVTKAGPLDAVFVEHARLSNNTLPNPLISAEATRAVENATLVGMIPILVVFGVAFNVINMVVFFRQGLSDHINLCLFALAACDTGYMLFMITWRCYAIIRLFSQEWGEFWQVKMIFMIGPYSAASDMSNSMTMLIALERCICVVWPLKAKVILTIGRIKAYMLLAFLVCALCLVLSFKFDMATYIDPVTNRTRYHSAVTSFYLRNSHLVDHIYEDINIIVPTVSFSVVIIATVVISVRMRSVVAFRNDAANIGRRGAAMTSSKERRETSVTRMLTVICVIFTVCMIPFVCTAFARLVEPEYRPEGHYTNILYATTAIQHVFLCINASVNFLVYYNMSTKFKATLRGMLKLDRQEEWTTNTEMSSNGSSKQVTISSIASSQSFRNNKI